jgi:hypothetical protein
MKSMLFNCLKDANELENVKKDVKSYESLLISPKFSNAFNRPKNGEIGHLINFSEYKDGLNYEKVIGREPNRILIESKKNSIVKIIKLLEK